MTCMWQEEQAYKLADGSLDEAVRQNYISHLADCAVCQERAAQAERLEALLDSALTPLAAPPALAAQVAQAVAAERAPRRFAWPWTLNRRAFSLALTSLLLAVSLLVVAAGPESVLAVVQKALFFVPGFGISAVDEDTLVNAQPVVIKQNGLALTVEALMSDGKQTTVKFEVTGLPGGKGEPKSLRVGQEAGQQPAKPPRQPLLRDASGREYQAQMSSQAVGGSEHENHMSGTTYFPPLPGDLTSIDLVLPGEFLFQDLRVPEAEKAEWVATIPLAHPAQRGLPQALPQTAVTTVRDITLRVAAVEAGPERTVVLLEGEAPGAARVTGLGANGSDILDAVTLRDEKGRTYQRVPERSQGVIWGPRELHQSLYFEPLAPDAGQLTLTVSEVQVVEDGKADVAIALAGHQPGETWSLNRTVNLAGFEVALKSATLGTGEERRQETGWLYVDVDLGPAVDGRMLSAFSVNTGRSSMASMGARDSRQFDYFGLELLPGETESRFSLTYPLVNVEGPWVLTLAAGEK